MERFDAIVVGAGPAGSTAAFRLSRAGARVLLLDRERFPRDKPCGGGLTYRAVRQLPVSVEPVVEDTVRRVQLGFRYGRSFERRTEEPLILMTQRRRLDAHLAEQAAEAGADFRDGVRATALEADDQGVTVRFGGSAASAPVAIGADGVNGLTARALGLTGRREHGVALEGTSPMFTRARTTAAAPSSSSAPSRAGTRGSSRRATTSTSASAAGSPRARGCARTSSAPAPSTASPAERLESVRGYRLPMRRPGDRARSGRVLLVGDAAGLVDPLSGRRDVRGLRQRAARRRVRAARRPRRLRAGARAGARPARSPPRGRRSTRSTASRT